MVPREKLTLTLTLTRVFETGSQTYYLPIASSFVRPLSWRETRGSNAIRVSAGGSYRTQSSEYVSGDVSEDIFEDTLKNVTEK